MYIDENRKFLKRENCICGICAKLVIGKSYTDKYPYIAYNSWLGKTKYLLKSIYSTTSCLCSHLKHVLQSEENFLSEVMNLYSRTLSAGLFLKINRDI